MTSSVAGTKSVPGNAVYCGTTTIYPGAIRTELLNTVAPSETKSMVEEFYRNVGIMPDAIANAVLYAVSQPDNVDVSDLIVRPGKES